jgi:hypothetical protein
LNRLVGIDCSEFYAKVRRGPKKNGEAGGLFVELHLDPSDPESESRLEIVVNLLNMEFASRPDRPSSNVATARPEDGLERHARQQELSRPAPLSRLSLPPNLDGSVGTNRNTAMRLVDADNDRAALERWLSSYESPATKDRYRNEAERLLLWAVFAKGKPFSSLNVHDAIEYINQFVLDPQPASMWVMKGRRPRDEPAWRPFRGPVDRSRTKAAIKRSSQ